MAANGVAEQRTAAVRQFNRFYTRQIGVLQESLLQSEFSLTAARVLYELAQREGPAASELSQVLGLDPGYLSRILRGFEKRGLLRKERSRSDGRQSHLRLTRPGRAAFASLNARSREETAALLGRLPPDAQARLVRAMGTIQTLLGGPQQALTPYLFRPHQPGDMGWVVQRHGALYAQEYGWNEEFEALVAEIAARFIRRFDPRRERCWIAEKDGAPIGSVFLVGHTRTVAKLRLLLVEPHARGAGVGQRLVEECIRFAGRTGYRRVMLWTNSVLVAARRIYEQAGFRLIKEEPHHSFGHDLVGETWELKL